MNTSVVIRAAIRTHFINTYITEIKKIAHIHVLCINGVQNII